MPNIFDLPTKRPLAKEPELFEVLAKNGHVRIERIISTGQITPKTEWYEQQQAEWVILLQGEAKLLFDHPKGAVQSLEMGDYVFIPAMRKHRVIYTSTTPPCIWLAVHF